MRLAAEDPIDLFCRLCDKPGFYLHASGFDSVWCFIEGFDSARDGGPLAGFREWLLLERQSWSNLSWQMLIRERVYPGTDPGQLPLPEEHLALLAELKRALLAFRKIRDELGLPQLYAAYQPMWEASRPAGTKV